MGEGATLHVLATPGHTRDSVCFWLEETQDSAAAILTGDTILGVISGRFDDLRTYRQSLEMLQRRVSHQPIALYPGHGAVVDACDSQSYLRSLLKSLVDRERAILH